MLNRVLSGYQPSGRSHIGNYLGAIKNFVALQHQYECYFFIADYHSLTENYNPKEKSAQILDVAADFLASGVDPKKAALFVQSDISQHTELAWIFNCITPISYLKRMTQFKDKSKQQESNVNAGLFNYPILQAADILIYKPYAVPVGEDQKQHLELTRAIARVFNHRFGKTFEEPITLLTKIPKVMSLLAPSKKMSKSLGDSHCIFLDDELEEIEEKLKKAVTDTGDGKSKGAKNLLALLKVFGEQKLFKKHLEDQKKGNMRYSELKADLAKSLASNFQDFRKNKKEFLKNPKKIVAILKDGSQRAQKIAAQTLEEVKTKIGIDYKQLTKGS